MSGTGLNIDGEVTTFARRVLERAGVDRTEDRVTELTNRIGGLLILQRFPAVCEELGIPPFDGGDYGYSYATAGARIDEFAEFFAQHLVRHSGVQLEDARQTVKSDVGDCLEAIEGNWVQGAREEFSGTAAPASASTGGGGCAVVAITGLGALATLGAAATQVPL